jgi:hypothetical protein
MICIFCCVIRPAAIKAGVITLWDGTTYDTDGNLIKWFRRVSTTLRHMLREFIEFYFLT